MQDKSTSRIHALFLCTDAMGATDQACLHQARHLAAISNTVPHALVVTDEQHADAAAAAARHAGIDSISLIRLGSPAEAIQAHQLVELFVALIRSAAAPFSEDHVLLVSAGTLVEEAAGAIAAQIDAAPLGRPAKLEFAADGTLQITRSAYGGRLMIRQTLQRGPCLAAVRAPDATATAGGAARADQVAVQLVLHEPVEPAYPLSLGGQTETEASLDGARLIVSGGRGMSGDKGFELLKELAKKLGGALGCSLPAVDAGWAPVARQVGQSGKYVSPETYIAVGISGTPQHLAGVDPHTEIIAINKDPDAAIFQVARVGVVADWEEFLPALLEEVNAKTAASSP